MIAAFFKTAFSSVKSWLYAGVGLLIVGLYTFAKVLEKQRDNARTEAEMHKQNAETATELNQTYTDLAKVKTEAREQANEKAKTDIKRPESGVDINSL